MKKRILNCFTVLTVLFSVLLSIRYISAYADVPSYITCWALNAGYVPQQKTSWCWVASAENACIAENHHSYNQYYAVQILKGSIDNQYPNVSGTIIDVANAVGVISSGYLNYTYGWDLSYNIIAEKIYNSHPVVAGIFPMFGDGHYVLIKEWNNSTGNRLITYYDPEQPGQYHTCTYDSFWDGSYYYGYRYLTSAYYN